MSSEIYQKFIGDSESKAFDLEHRKIINYNISRYNQQVPVGKRQFSEIEKAKKRGSVIKHRVINDLDKYLIEFESNFIRKGGKVIWAQNTKEALREIVNILKKHKARMVVKMKSMASEEIELNDFLLKNKIEPQETDLGEFIVQLSGEHPYHIVTPAMHKSKEDVAALFNERFQTPVHITPEEITYFVRNLLREKFTSADAGISGANFLIADAGAVALTENEGNGFMSFSFPRIHIVISGIEKVVPSIDDLHLLWPLLATHGTGQKITVYNSIITGPRQEDESDGPDEMYVILLDNNRTELLKQKEQRRALSCIHCGACLNACPVYRNIGGHAYGTTYSGPIGAVVSPFLKGFKEFRHLSYASSLCGSCTEVCPVKVNLHELLLYNRNDTVNRKYPSMSERMAMRAWNKTMNKRWMVDFFGGRIKNIILSRFFSKSWGKKRDLPTIRERSFRQYWMNSRG
ncbi:MAG: LutB/LldF family L-lactate oxidation iron-sulfur protein [Bacteroidetes bacterium]|nr:LutB/LldF family L-lactate oxidation iron-sulfur protein [Bacteroidota bacterium]